MVSFLQIKCLIINSLFQSVRIHLKITQQCRYIKLCVQSNRTYDKSSLFQLICIVFVFLLYILYLCICVYMYCMYCICFKTAQEFVYIGLWVPSNFLYSTACINCFLSWYNLSILDSCGRWNLYNPGFSILWMEFGDSPQVLSSPLLLDQTFIFGHFHSCHCDQYFLFSCVYVFVCVCMHVCLRVFVCVCVCVCDNY